MDEHTVIIDQYSNVAIYEINRNEYKHMFHENILKLKGETLKKIIYDEIKQQLFVLGYNYIFQIYEISIGPQLCVEKVNLKKDGNGSKILDFFILKDYIILKDTGTNYTIINKNTSTIISFELPENIEEIQTSVLSNMLCVKHARDMVVYEITITDVLEKGRKELNGITMLNANVQNACVNIASFNLSNIEDLDILEINNNGIVCQSRIQLPKKGSPVVLSSSLIALSGRSTSIYSIKIPLSHYFNIEQVTLYKAMDSQWHHANELPGSSNSTQCHIYPIFLCSKGLFTFVFNRERLKPILKLANDFHYKSLDVLKIPSKTLYTYIGISKEEELSTGFVACELTSGVVLKTSIDNARLIKILNISGDTIDLLVFNTQSHLRYTSFKTILDNTEYEILKEREINYEFELSISDFEVTRNYIFIIDDKKRLLYSRKSEEYENLFDDIRFLKTIQDPVTQILATENYYIIICCNCIFFLNEDLEIACSYQNDGYVSFHPFKDLLFCANIAHVDILTPYGFKDIIFNQTNRVLNVFSVAEDTIFCYYTFGKRDNLKLGYCYKSFDAAQINIMNYIGTKEKKKEELLQHLYLHNDKFHLSNKFVEFLISQQNNELILSYYYQNGYLGNLSKDVRCKLAGYLKFDGCLPNLLIQKKDTTENLEILSKILNTDYTGINKIDTPLYYSLTRNIDALIDKTKNDDSIRFYIENSALAEKLKARCSKFIASSYQEILDKELKKQHEAQTLFNTILAKAPIKFGADRYTVVISQGYENLTLQPYKKESLEQILHGTSLKTRLVKAQENQATPLDNKDETDNLLIYIHPMKNEEDLINRVNSQKLSFQGKLNLIDLDEKEPLEFEDKWGRKIASMSSIKFTKSNFILIDRKVLNSATVSQLEFWHLECWFFSYYDKDIILFSDSKQQLVIGIRNSKLFINSNKANVYHDKENRLGYKIRNWFYMSLSVKHNGTVVLEVKDKLLYKGKLNIEAKNLFNAGLVIFPQFEGEVCEIRLWSSERSKAQIEEQKTIPLPKIFEEANSMKIKLKAGKQKRQKESVMSLSGLEFTSPKDNTMKSKSEFMADRNN